MAGRKRRTDRKSSLLYEPFEADDYNAERDETNGVLHKICMGLKCLMTRDYFHDGHCSHGNVPYQSPDKTHHSDVLSSRCSGLQRYVGVWKVYDTHHTRLYA